MPQLSRYQDYYKDKNYLTVEAIDNIKLLIKRAERYYPQIASQYQIVLVPHQISDHFKEELTKLITQCVDIINENRKRVKRVKKDKIVSTLIEKDILNSQILDANQQSLLILKIRSERNETMRSRIQSETEIKQGELNLALSKEETKREQIKLEQIKVKNNPDVIKLKTLKNEIELEKIKQNRLRNVPSGNKKSSSN